MSEIEQKVFLYSFIPTSLNQLVDEERENKCITENSDRKMMHLITGVMDNLSVKSNDCPLDENSIEADRIEDDNNSTISNLSLERVIHEKQFTLKNSSKEERKSHKKKIKEDRREARKEKVPKHIKKKNRNRRKVNCKT